MRLVKHRHMPSIWNSGNSFDTFFDNFFNNEIRSSVSGWLPRVDINDSDSKIVITADIPGVEKEDIKISIEDDILTISGSKKIDRDESKGGFHRVERYSGEYTRSFHLPNTIDSSKISASYKNGVLEIELPKREEAMKREIDVKIN